MGGSITAALFLKEFIKEGVEWAHLDIAGPVRAGRRAPGCRAAPRRSARARPQCEPCRCSPVPVASPLAEPHSPPPPKPPRPRQVWDEKQGLPTGYGAATLAKWATAQGQK
jgi:hypothetical protein